ncbi:MAG: radical SAM protein [Candidatus Omnitrophica bacterium]|nr:radical SAM protein [Candidatus Omnitrophota bacterium]
MKLSRFTYIVDDYPEPTKSLVFNGRTEALIVLNHDVRELLRKLPTPTESLTEIEQQALHQLAQQGIVSPREIDENKIMEDWFHQFRYSTKQMEVMILTTYNCNFACPYCFEEGVKDKKYLHEPKADQIIEWMQQKALKNNPKEIHIIFYGGEPLLNIPIIEYIGSRMKSWSGEHGIKFFFSLVTNGSALTAKVADRLVPCGLKVAKITIDGPKEIHDKFRPFLNGKGSFDIIMENIKAVADKLQVTIGANFNSHSYPYLFQLLDYLEREGLREKIALIDFKPITDRPNQVIADVTACPTHETDPEYADQVLNIKREFMKRGFKTSEPMGTNFCEFKAGEMKSIVDTNGIIYKCPSMVGLPQFGCGTVEQELTQNVMFQNLMKMKIVDFEKQCKTCEFIPICAGGCNWMSYLRKKDYTKVYCEKKLYKKTIQDMVKLKYEQEMLRKKRKNQKTELITIS